MIINVLFVCYENICRSPMAEGVFSDLLSREGKSCYFEVASAGTVSWQGGCAPDERAVRVSEENGIDISSIRAQCIHDLDLHTFDWIFVMDNENYEHVLEALGPVPGARLNMMTDFSPGMINQEIDDPYYGDERDFRSVHQRLRRASEDILTVMVEEYSHLRGVESAEGESSFNASR
jgi:protein-tyrosine phosphatase